MGLIQIALSSLANYKSPVHPEVNRVNGKHANCVRSGPGIAARSFLRWEGNVYHWAILGCCGYSDNWLSVFTASPWSEESLSAGELSPSSIASCLWPRSTLALGWLRREEPCVRVVHPFFRPRRTSPVQLSWGPLSTLAARKVWITDHSSNVG